MAIDDGRQSVSEELEDDVVVCHIHDSSNQHIGTGEGLSVGMAVSKAVKDVEDDRSDLPMSGSFGCSMEKQGEHTAHERASSIQDKAGNDNGLPGADIDLR